LLYNFREKVIYCYIIMVGGWFTKRDLALYNNYVNGPLVALPWSAEIVFNDTIRYSIIYVRSKADEMASLI